MVDTRTVAVGVVALAMVAAPAVGTVFAAPPSGGPPVEAGPPAGVGGGPGNATNATGGPAGSAAGPPAGVASFLNTSPVRNTTPTSLRGKIRVERQYRRNTSVELVENSSTNYTVDVTIPNATNVTFFLQATAVTASQNLSNVTASVDGDPVAFGAANASNTSWITFEVDHFSTRRVTVSSRAPGGSSQGPGGSSQGPGGSSQGPGGSSTRGPSDADATFAVSNLTAPANVTWGERVGVSATVTNTGNESGAERVEYRVDGTARDRARVALDPGNSTNVSMTVDTHPLSVGTHTHGLFTAEDDATAPLTVEAANRTGGLRGPPGNLTAFRSTSPVRNTTPTSLRGKVRVEGQYLDDTSVRLLTNTTSNTSLNITVTGHARNVTFFLHERAIAASQNLSDVTMYLDGREHAYTDTSAGPGNSSWLRFEVPHFSTRTVTFDAGRTADATSGAGSVDGTSGAGSVDGTSGAGSVDGTSPDATSGRTDATGQAVVGEGRTGPDGTSAPTDATPEGAASERRASADAGPAAAAVARSVAGSDGRVALGDVRRAVGLWLTGTPVPDSGGGRVDLGVLGHLLGAWATGGSLA